jgi:hypothetical protein
MGLISRQGIAIGIIAGRLGDVGLCMMWGLGRPGRDNCLYFRLFRLPKDSTHMLKTSYVNLQLLLFCS